MSLYELHRVKLGDVEGRGYAFKRKTAFGKARRGVFFPDKEEDLEKLQAQEAVLFNGPCYYRQRGPREQSFEVAVFNVTPTAMGGRADFEAVDNPEPILHAS